MKFKLIILLAVICVNTYANKKYNVRENGNSYIYIDSLRVSPNIAYNNAQNWILKNTSSYKTSVQFESLEQKKIIAKSGVETSYKTASNDEHIIIFDLTLEIKEGKYRLTMDNIKQYLILHPVDFELLDISDEEIIETDIVKASCYDKDPVTGEEIFFYADRYKRNALELEELNKKKQNAKKKELEEIEKQITRLEDDQAFIDKERNYYQIINSVFNNYIDQFDKAINTDDDF